MDKKRKKSKINDDNEIEIKLKKGCEEIVENKKYELPTEILLQIFSLLSLKDLCKCASVCKLWRKIAHDETLWFNLNLSKLDIIDLKRLWKLVRQSYALKAKSIEIHTPDQKKHQMNRMLTPAFLNKLNDSCKSLIIMKLKYVDVSWISVDDLSENLKELFLMRCEIPIDWFVKNNFNNLETLDLTESSRVCTKHIKDLVENCKKSLKRLILSSCYRVDNKTVEIITTEFLDLTCLKLDGTKITDLGVHWICTRLKFLKELSVGKSNFNPDIEFIKDSFRHIENFKLIHKKQ